MSELSYFPPIEEGRTALTAPVQRVTLLEDRAQVRRSGRAQVAAGLNRLAVSGVSTVLQDVSLVASVEGGRARVADVRARRAMRVLEKDRPEAIVQVEREIRALEERFGALAEDRAHADGRRAMIEDMLAKGSQELPEDAGWGLGHHQVWKDSFESLFGRARELRRRALELYFSQSDLLKDFHNAVARRVSLDRLDAHFAGWIELDLLAESAGEVEVVLEYVVPSAIWRPMHSARLVEGKRLSFATQAAVWQATGEDWDDVELCFSTARSSLGTSEPMLTDDLLRAQKKAEQVEVSIRQVAIAKAGVSGGEGGGGKQLPSGVDLPGVDDGGDVQTLKAKGRCRIKADGRPNVVPIDQFEVEALAERVGLPELDEKVFLKATAANAGRIPILAGPVELLKDSGFVGWTQVLFVAPKERFELSFGPDDAIRVVRKTKEDREVDKVDKWTRLHHVVTLYLSNLAGEPTALRLTERIPVSEIEHVKVALFADKTSGAPSVDQDGLVSWWVELEPHDRKKIKLEYELAVAPGVQGL